MSVQQRTALLSVLAAASLMTIKLIVGLLSNSLGLVAEAIHSGSDLVAALLTYLALGVAAQPPDREHPFGHGKAEHLSALAEGAVLVAVSVGIIGEAAARLLGSTQHVDTHWYVLAILVIVILIDATRAYASRRAARIHTSAALGANALHFTLDMLGSLAVLLGLLVVQLVISGRTRSQLC